MRLVCLLVLVSCLRKHPGSAPQRDEAGGRAFALRDIAVATSCNLSEYKLCTPNEHTTIECQVTGCGDKTHVIARVTPDGRDEIDEAILCPEDSTKMVADSNIVLRCLVNYMGHLNVGSDLMIEEKTLVIDAKAIMSGEVCVTVDEQSLANNGKLPFKYTTTPEAKSCGQQKNIELLQLNFKI